MSRRATSAAFLCLAACSSVPLPEEVHYRLEWPVPSGGELQRLGVLRVLDLSAASHLQGDELVLAVGGVRVHRDELHRWAAPLDRMVTEALLQGLSRTRLFDGVKAAADGGVEDWALHGRILSFEQVLDGDGRRALVVIEAWVERAGREVLHSELRAESGLADGEPETAVRGLSLALAQVVERLAAELRKVAEAERRPDSGPGR